MPDPGPSKPRTGNYCQIWLIDAAQSRPADLERAREALNDAERARIDGVAHPGRRGEQLLARGGLRLILAARLDIEPSAVQLTTRGRGKPVLAPEHRSAIEFNITHADHLVAIAVSEGRRVGIDLEGPRRLPGWQKVARRYFSAVENTALQNQPEHLREGAFFACWVRKEALVKAASGGIAMGLSTFDVNVEPQQPPLLLASRNPDLGAANWQLRDLNLGQNRRACLAIEGADPVLLNWPGSPFRVY